MLANDQFKQGAKILAVHTGGCQYLIDENKKAILRLPF